jgi:uncharacterized pyridoxamine 5'-phosphate oxidase family protein
MKQLSGEIIQVFQKQGFVIVSTLDIEGRIHCSAKGIVGIEEQGRVFIIDLYHGVTFNNLKRNPLVSITAIDEEAFVGYTLKGKATVVEREKIKKHIISGWEDKVIQRISRRVINDIKREKKSRHHPEAIFPHPRYFIEIDVEEIVDLTPAHLKAKPDNSDK